MEKHILARPIEYNGELVTSIEMDLDGLKVNDLSKAEREARLLLGKQANLAVPETNKTYLGCVAAKAAKVDNELIRNLYAKDYTQITMLVMNFLLGGDSSSEEMEEEEVQIPSETSDLKMKMKKETSGMESPKE